MREIGPRPLRTARGAGRRFLLDRVLRDRELELFFFLDPEDRDEDVLLLRDPGGEDVRVAML
ncbi:hypothetical protein [Nocardioides sp.]|uniref:hypothetical protein n=1 Tax=Nocardioides sp. TaxID=35761 RepID=UPI002ED481B7